MCLVPSTSGLAVQCIYRWSSHEGERKCIGSRVGAIGSKWLELRVELVSVWRWCGTGGRFRGEAM